MVLIFSSPGSAERQAGDRGGQRDEADCCPGAVEGHLGGEPELAGGEYQRAGHVDDGVAEAVGQAPGHTGDQGNRDRGREDGGGRAEQRPVPDAGEEQHVAQPDREQRGGEQQRGQVGDAERAHPEHGASRHRGPHGRPTNPEPGERPMERRLWSQVVAVASGLPASVVAVWAIRSVPATLLQGR